MFKNASSGSFKNDINKMSQEVLCLIYLNKMIWYQITYNVWYALKPNQTKPNEVKVCSIETPY